MSSLDTTTAAAPRVGTGECARELRAMLALALPLALTQLSQILVHTTEVLLLGRLGPAPLAAATLAAKPGIQVEGRLARVCRRGRSGGGLPYSAQR